MLAQNFKTAAELGLKDAVAETLPKILTMLETNELVWTPTESPIPNGFNMAHTDKHRTNEWGEECGTACCILGWVRRLGNIGPETFDPFVWRVTRDQTNAWERLVMPRKYESGCHTTAQTAVALRAYLSTGKADWS